MMIKACCSAETRTSGCTETPEENMEESDAYQTERGGESYTGHKQKRKLDKIHLTVNPIKSTLTSTVLISGKYV